MKLDVSNSKTRFRLADNLFLIQNKAEMVPRVRPDTNLGPGECRWKGDFELLFQDEDGYCPQFPNTG
jgi:hypothetical protein